MRPVFQLPFAGLICCSPTNQATTHLAPAWIISQRTFFENNGSTLYHIKNMSREWKALPGGTLDKRVL